MGYTTKFLGCIDLSRQLTFKEAKFLLDLSYMDDRNEAKNITGTNAYMQWVPNESLDGIVWYGEENFYDYENLMKWLCLWLKDAGIEANGELVWSGEDPDDIGNIVVTKNDVHFNRGKTISRSPSKPLTAKKLSEMALEKIIEKPEQS